MTERSTRPLRLATIRSELETLVEPGERWRWLVLVVLALMGAAIEAIGALIVLYMTNWLLGLETEGWFGRFFPTTDPDSMAQGVVLAIGAFFVLRGVFSLSLTWFKARAVHMTAARISDRLFRRYLTAPYQLFLNRNSSELMRNALSSVEGVATRFLTPLVSVLTESIVVLVLAGLLAVSAPVATMLVTVVLGVVTPLVMWTVRSRLRKYGKQAEQASQTSLAIIQQTVSESRQIRILARQRYFADAFREDRLAFADSRLHLAVFSKLPRVAIETLVFLLLVGFLAASSSLVTVGSPGVLGLFAYAALRIMPGLNQIVSGLNLMRYGQASMDNVIGDLRGDASELPEAPSGRVPLNWSSLSMRDLTFRYASGASAAVANVDLTLDRGAVLGLVGHTGSGKSTLVDLILGLLEPTSGSIEIDGRELADVRDSWQANLGLVPQDVHLLDDSIIRNVAFGVPQDEIDRSRVEECLRIAQLAEFVANTADGVDTTVGERGTSISGGERQRIAIARALYTRPTLLILDEGTSAIDTATEASLISDLKESGSIDTLIVVSHRLSSLRMCDTIATMEQGRIVDYNTYDTLIASDSTLPYLGDSPDAR